MEDQNSLYFIATSQYPRRTSGDFTVNRRKLSWFGHVCRHDTLLKIIPLVQGTVDGIGVAEEDRVNSVRTTSRNVHASRCRR